MSRPRSAFRSTVRRRIASRLLAPALLGLAWLAGCSGSGGTEPAPAPPEPQAVRLQQVKLRVGTRADLDLSRAGTRLSAAAASAVRYTTSLSPVPNGLQVDGAILRGTPERPGKIVATVSATDARGVITTDTVTLVAIRATTTGTPSLPAQPIDYTSETLPLHFTDPFHPDDVIATADNTPSSNPPSNAGITLGRVLFYDTRLSADNTVACASCHVQQFGFSDPAPRSLGIAGQSTTRHSMGLSNVRYYHGGRMFWDERSATLEAQSLTPIESPVEMGNGLPEVVARLTAIPFYPPLFAAAFGSPEVTAERIGKALAQFERALVSHGSRLDRALVGNGSAVFAPDYAAYFTAEEMHGMALFRPMPAPLLASFGLPPIASIGCSGCHQTAIQIGSVAPCASPTTRGPSCGDPQASAPFPSGPGPANIGLDAVPADPGATGIGDFKVPSLRNVAVTAPYMHDGRFDTLEAVIGFFAHGVQDTPATSRLLRGGDAPDGPVRRPALSDADVKALVAFLKALTDDAFLDDPRFSDPFAD